MAANKIIKPTSYVEHLQLISFRGVSFPITSLRTEMAQALIVHEYPDKDAAHVESSGRKPLIIQGTAVFDNGISPGKGETWTAGDLFPNQYNLFMAACSNGSPGILIHPTRGPLTVKCQHANETLDAHARGGVTVDVSWIETVNIDPKVADSQDTDGRATAVDMYNELERVTLTLPKKFPKKPDFLQLMDSIAGFIQTVELIGMQLSAAVDRALFHVNNLLDVIEGANTNLLGKLRLLAERLKRTLLRVKRVALSTLTSPVGHVVATATTVADVARTLGVSVVDLMRLNPRETSRPVLAAGTRLIYVRPA